MADYLKGVAVTVSVNANNRKNELKIISKDGLLYLPTDIESKYAYQTCINGRQTTVMPYQLEICHIYQDVVWGYVYIDGLLIGRRPLHPGQTWYINGMRTSTGVQELVFAFPIEGNQETSYKMKEVGCIRVELKEAIFVDWFYQPVYRRMPKVDLPGNSCLAPLSKAACQQKTQGKYTMLSTNTGRIIQYNGEKVGHCQKAKYKTGRLLQKMEINYMPSHSLQVLGVLPKPKQINTAIEKPKKIQDDKENDPPTGNILSKEGPIEEDANKVDKVCDNESKDEVSNDTLREQAKSTGKVDKIKKRVSEIPIFEPSAIVPVYKNGEIPLRDANGMQQKKISFQVKGKGSTAIAARKIKKRLSDIHNAPKPAMSEASTTVKRIKKRLSEVHNIPEAVGNEGSNRMVIKKRISEIQANQNEESASISTKRIKKRISDIQSDLKGNIQAKDGQPQKKKMCRRSARLQEKHARAAILSPVLSPCNSNSKKKPFNTSTPLANSIKKKLRRSLSGSRKSRELLGMLSSSYHIKKEALDAQEMNNNNDKDIEQCKSPKLSLRSTVRKDSIPLITLDDSENNEVDMASTNTALKIKTEKIKQEIFTPSKGPLKVEPITPGMITSMQRNRDLYSQVLTHYQNLHIKQEPKDTDKTKTDAPEDNLDFCYPVDEEGDLFFVFPRKEIPDLNCSDVIYMGDEECHIFDVTPQEIQVIDID